LSEELQISRTPVREAMSRLAEEGLLERAPGGGFQVRSFTLRDVTDAIELRGVLEGTAARLAAEQGVDPVKLKEIKDILDRLEACFAGGEALADFDAYSELNALFHARLADLCQSPVILRELERVKSLPFASPSAFVLGRADAARSHRSLVQAQAQHRALVQAIESREGARAEFIAREHARIARGNLEETFVAEAPEGEGVPGLSLIVR
jgi:GntR family transcriptional regulator of vanillate catabolism